VVNEAPVNSGAFLLLAKAKRYNRCVPTPTTMEEKRSQREAPSGFSWQQRLALWFISNLGVLAIHIICSTLRFEVSAEDEVEDPRKLPEPATVAPFWHRAVFSATYFYRHRGIAVMTSRSFDGEYIARIISHFGFKPVRGSSSRGAVSALLGMHDVVEEQGVAAFTIDGPRGPKYVAKPGPVLLAKRSGAPIRCFYVAVERGWALNSWDEFVIPRPFTRAYIRWSARITVPSDADSQQMEALHGEMQAALERVTEYAQTAVGSNL
jgi:lysophospholipid acyltransferase (LPLAT)-like uncharacterized protein